MKLLLDTHTFLWALSEPNRLSKKQIAAMEDPTNKVYVSSISITEIAIKASLGKLELGFDPIEIFAFKEESKSLPRADVWLRLTKALELEPRNCTAVVGSARTAKAALTAGLRVVSVPDQFTAFQDFGGSFSVTDSLDEIDYKDLFDY